MPQQLKKKKKYWQKLLYNMADGNHLDIAELKKLDVFEFYARLEIYEEDLTAKLAKLKNTK